MEVCNIQTENTPSLFFIQLFFYIIFSSAAGSIHRKACTCPCPWLHPPTGNTSDRQTMGRKQRKGLNTWKHH